MSELQAMTCDLILKTWCHQPYCGNWVQRQSYQQPDWPRLANCVTLVVCLESRSYIHHRALLRTMSFQTAHVHWPRKSFPLEVQPIQLQGQVCTDLHVEATLFFLELTYKLSQIQSIPPSCSHWCFNFRNVAMDSKACFVKSSSERCLSV